MTRINGKFNALTKDNRKALIIFLSAGDPSMAATSDLIEAAYDNGADIIELGVPFCDSSADGPVVQNSFTRAIAKGANLVKTLKLVEKSRVSSEVPLVLMLASTLVVHHGVKKFMRDSNSAGVDGLIIPDAPVDEYGEFLQPARDHGLDTILLAAPTSTPARRKKIAKVSTGFLYYVNVTGITGGKKATAADIGKNIASIKRLTKTPVCAGFGISKPEEARAISKVADGIIIGSKAIKIVEASKDRKTAVKNLGAYVRSVRKAIDLK